MTTIAQNVELAVTPLTGTTGAEIRGVSLREPLAASTVSDIRQALFDYRVIFFPEQHLLTSTLLSPSSSGRSLRDTRHRRRTMVDGD